MKPDYLKFYEKPSVRGIWRFLWDYLSESSKLRKLSLANRQKDYLRLMSHSDKLSLHHEMNRSLLEGRSGWDGYDYGEGYFYQSCKLAGITGFRDTEGRIREMRLRSYVEQKRVLEIGCNSGFLAVALCENAKEIVGMDVNPYLIAIGNALVEHFDLKNLQFSTQGFEEYNADEPFDVVLSFANHSTYDGKTKHTLDEFFGKCHRLLCKGGRLMFESHPPELEPPDVLGKTLEIIQKYFHFEKQAILQYGSFLDRDRTFVIAKKRE